MKKKKNYHELDCWNWRRDYMMFDRMKWRRRKK